jgi:hypothetical protein
VNGEVRYTHFHPVQVWLTADLAKNIGYDGGDIAKRVGAEVDERTNAYTLQFDVSVETPFPLISAQVVRWREELQVPVMIQYDAVAVAEGGLNDHVSDLNCFWMASDPGAPAGAPLRPRSGAFADYDDLLAYYVGQGGNRNTTTRMRRYVGQVDNRPLLPQHWQNLPPLPA